MTHEWLPLKVVTQALQDTGLAAKYPFAIDRITKTRGLWAIVYYDMCLSPICRSTEVGKEIFPEMQSIELIEFHAKVYELREKAPLLAFKYMAQDICSTLLGWAYWPKKEIKNKED